MIRISLRPDDSINQIVKVGCCCTRVQHAIAVILMICSDVSLLLSHSCIAGMLHRYLNQLVVPGGVVMILKVDFRTSYEIGAGNGLVPSVNKPLPEPMLTQIYIGISWPQWVKYMRWNDSRFPKHALSNINCVLYMKKNARRCGCLIPLLECVITRQT